MDLNIAKSISLNNIVLGVGPAPIGWPNTVPWEGFSGTTRSKLSKDEITGIILSMLQTVGFDPNQHVINAGAADVALVENEQVEDPVEANPVQADIGNIEEVTNSEDDEDINDNQIGIKRKFGS